MQPPDHMFTFTQIGPARPRTGFTTGSSRAGPPYKLQWPLPTKNQTVSSAAIFTFMKSAVDKRRPIHSSKQQRHLAQHFLFDLKAKDL